MSGFGHYDQTALAVEDEIVTYGVLLKIDWNDHAQVRSLAAEAVACQSENRLALLHSSDERENTKGYIFALSELMLDILRQAAEAGVEMPSVGVWRVLGPALAEAREHGLSSTPA